jgi:putative permease
MQLLHGAPNKPFVKVLLIVGIIIFAFWITSFFPDLVLTLIISTLTAFVLKPLVRILEFRLDLKRGVAIGIVFILVGSIVVLTLYETIPLLMSKIRLMYDQLKTFPIEEKLTLAAKEMAGHIPFIDPATIGEKVHHFMGLIIASATEAGGTAASYLMNLVIIPFITYFILAEGDEAIKKLVERIPNKYFEMTLNIIDKLSNELMSYLR